MAIVHAVVLSNIQYKNKPQ